jgi:phage repressor protein C with HTH and peptisase S24 domain
MNTTIERIKQISDNEAVKITNLEKKIGASKGVLSRALARKTDIQSKWITKLVENYPEYNPEWLITGKGNMLKERSLPSEVVNEPKAQYKKINNDTAKLIPLVSAKAVGGFSGTDFLIQEKDVKAYYTVPKFQHKQISFMIEMEGSSMYPKYNSGDVLACKIISQSNFIQWNKTHVIGTNEQGILVKRVKKGKNSKHLKMISDNKKYDSFEVHTDEISGIALVVGVIRLE